MDGSLEISIPGVNMEFNSPILFVLIDGLRPDALEQATLPALKGLISQASYTLHARTVFPSVTLPCITSIFLSATPEMHSTIGNYFNSNDWQAPGLIDAFHQAGGRTAAFYNWEQLRDISRPGSLDFSICLNQAESPDLPLGESDKLVAEMASSFLANYSLDFTFVYLGCLDTAGHRHGWMSTEYLKTLENADHCVDKLLNAIRPSTQVVLASDHGGHGDSHGSDEDIDMTVPLIIRGNSHKTGELPEPVSVLDIAPSIAHLAGVDIPTEWMGKSLL